MLDILIRQTWLQEKSRRAEQAGKVTHIKVNSHALGYQSRKESDPAEIRKDILGNRIYRTSPQLADNFGNWYCEIRGLAIESAPESDSEILTPFSTVRPKTGQGDIEPWGAQCDIMKLYF